MSVAVDKTTEKIIEFLKTKNGLTDDQLGASRKKAETENVSVLDALLLETYVQQDQMVEAIATVCDVAPMRLWKYGINHECLELVPREIVTGHMVLPVAKVNAMVTLAMKEPWNEKTISDVRQACPNLHFVFAVASREDLQEAIGKLHGNNYEQELKSIIKSMEGPSVELVDSKAQEGVITDASILASLTDQEPIVRLTNKILTQGIELKSSDIFIEPQATSLVVRYRIDGVLKEGLRPPRSMHQGVISRLKIMSSLDIAEQRLPQDGRVKIPFENRTVEFRLSTIPSYYGEKACLRILDPGQVKLKLDLLGIDPQNLNQIHKASGMPYGMILVCGPTGSGKTTTLYSVLNHVSSIEKNIITVEDPVEYHIDGINQVNVHSEVGLTFAEALRSILRQDPDVILIGEIRDKETLNIGVKAALTGHLVLSTLHTNSAAGSITRMTNMGVEPFLINASVIMVASQRLLRKLCAKCKEEFEAHEEHLKVLRMAAKEKIKLFKAKGCEACQNSGYKGRASILEILMLTPGMRDLIVQHAPEYEIKALARKEGMMTLRENAIKKVIDGTTSIDEALRVSMRDEEDAG